MNEPKFKEGDRVEFDVNGRTVRGYVYIVDAYGTWEKPGIVSYDIMECDETGKEICLWKHNTESSVRSDKTM